MSKAQNCSLTRPGEIIAKMERDGLKTKSVLAERLATDGRFLVEEVDGRAFWPGQPYIADCGISASHRPADHTAIYARRLTQRYNAHLPIVKAARELLRTMTKPRKGPVREAYENLTGILSTASFYGDLKY